MRIGRTIFLGLLLAFLFIVCFIAVELSFAPLAKGQEVEIDTLVIDRTQTKIGYEFYRNFINLWEPPQGVKGYNILITEKANPRWGSLIWIEVGGLISKKIVYKKLLKPRTREIEEAAQEGISLIIAHLYRLREYEKEVTGKDMVGNGIY